jgi:hypothetical protein
MQGHSTRLITLATGMLLAGLLSRPGAAVEPGQAPQTEPGITIGAAAVAPPPGLYMIDQAFYYGFKLTGPGAVPGPNVPRGFVPEAEADFYWVTDWKFLGATYSAYVAFPFVAESIESALLAGFPGVSFAGMHNTYIAPVQLHWNLGNGFFAEAAFGLYVPDGTIGGPLGDSNTGSPYFTFQPQLVLSYFNDGWNLTADLYYEINTRNQRSGYRSGDVFHADRTATKRFGKWTFGPVAYYVAQTTSDSPGAAFDAALTAAIPQAPGGFTGLTPGSSKDSPSALSSATILDLSH